jgi:hypothetical protein
MFSYENRNLTILSKLFEKDQIVLKQRCPPHKFEETVYAFRPPRPFMASIAIHFL